MTGHCPAGHLALFSTILLIVVSSHVCLKSDWNFDQKLCKCDGFQHVIRSRMVNGNEANKNDFRFVATMFMKQSKFKS